MDLIVGPPTRNIVRARPKLDILISSVLQFPAVSSTTESAGCGPSYISRTELSPSLS